MNIKVISVGVPNVDELEKDEQFRLYSSLLSTIRKIKQVS